MIFSNISVSGANFDVDSFLISQGIESDFIWHKGEARRKGTYTDSGFCIYFPDTDSWDEALRVVQEFLNIKNSILNKISFYQADIELIFGVTVGEEKSFVACLNFPVEFLAQLVKLGIKLEIAAYPTSDENE